MAPRLQSKHVLVFAATGAVGGGTARALAAEGADVWLSGRRADALEALRHEIEADGGRAHADVVDATEAHAVSVYVDRVAAEAGRVDAVFNAIGLPPAELGYPERSTTQGLERFLRPLQVIVGSSFLTARAAGAHMARQGSGSIVTLSATLSGLALPFMAGISAACGAVEAMKRSLTGELGPAGVRVNCVRATAMPETRTIQETSAGQAAILGISPEQMALPPIPRGRPISVAETAAAVAFLASDASSGMTGQVVNVCGGTILT